MNGPGVEKNNLDVEDKEEHSDEVKLYGKTYPGVSLGWIAGFEGLPFNCRKAFRAENLGQKEKGGYNNPREYKKNQYREVGVGHYRHS